MSQPNSSETISPDAVARAVRFGFVALILALSYPNIQRALDIEIYQQIWSDMLSGTPLPWATVFVIKAQPLLFAVSILLPLLTLATLFISRLATSLYLCSVLLVLTLTQLFFTWHAITAPVYEVVKRMQGGAAGA